jgi:hypothetical protein
VTLVVQVVPAIHTHTTVFIVTTLFNCESYVKVQTNYDKRSRVSSAV